MAAVAWRLFVLILGFALTATRASGQQLTVNSNSFSFLKGPSATPLPATALLTIRNTGTSALTGVGLSAPRYGAGQPTGWLSLGAPPSTTLAAGGSWDVNLGAQTTGVAGTFTADFDVVSANGGSQQITVSLVVSSAGLTANTTSFSFGSASSPQSFTVSNIGGVTATGITVGAPTYGAGQPSGWLSVSFGTTSISAGGVASGSVSVSGVQSLPTGNYSATFVIAAANVAGPGITFSVALAVSTPTPRIAVSVSSLNFTTTVGQDAAPGSFLVTNSGGGTLTGVTGRAIYPPGSPAWVPSLGVTSTTAPTTMTLYPVTRSLAAGSYAATMLVYSTTSGIIDTARVALSLTVAPTVTPAPVASVAVQLGTAQLQVGSTTQATVTLTDAGGNVLTGRTVTYSSSDAAVATVSASGLVAGVGAGTATITATSEGKSGSATVTVAPVAAPTIVLSTQVVLFAGPAGGGATPSQSVSITNGGTGSLSVAVGSIAYGAGQTGGWLSAMLSSAATPATLTLQASSTGLAQGTYTASVAITSSTSGVTNSPQTVSVTLTVPPAPVAPVASVTIVLGSATLDVGGQTQASVTLRDANGAQLFGRAITFASSNTNVATVSATGSVIAVGSGATTIVATSEGKMGAATLTVRSPTPAPVAKITVVLEQAVLVIGATTQAMATLRDSTGALLSGRTIEWLSSNAGVARVSSAGLVTAVAAGTANIVAASEGQTGLATITVSNPPAVIVLERTSVSMTATAAASVTSTLSVTNGGAGSLGGLAVTVAGATPDASMPTWLSATLSSVAAPATLRLTADAARLAPGTYRGLVTVSSPSTQGVSAQSALVTLVIGEPTAATVLKDVLTLVTPGAGAALSLEIRQYLDQRGNNNGQFDVGDALAYFDRTGASLDRAAALRQWMGKPPVDSLKGRQP